MENSGKAVKDTIILMLNKSEDCGRVTHMQYDEIFLKFIPERTIIKFIFL